MCRLFALVTILWAAWFTPAAVTHALAGNNGGQAFSTWPDTGQSKCYNNTVEIPCPAEGQPFHGQDAQHLGPARSYTLLNGGTMVQDNVTGLVWEMKNSMDGVKNYSNPNDADNTYLWCDPNPYTNGGNQGTCTTNDTADFLAQLNSGSGFSGYTDWRMPTIKELASLVDFGRINPAIDTMFIATTQSEGGYWSSTTISGYPSIAWLVSFYNGFIWDYNAFTANKSYPLYVRAVRGGQSQPENRFVDNNDGTVTDTGTCLQWQKATMDTKDGAGPDTYTWQEAMAVSEGLGLAGHTDWRLPDINELHSLVNFSRYPLNIDPIFEATTQSSNYWSSTTETYNTSYANLVHFYYGYDSLDKSLNKSLSYYVRAVRGGQCGALGPFDLTLSFGGAGSGVVTIDPPDVQCTSNCSQSFSPGTVVTLEASADSGSTFSGWIGSDCSGTGTCQITMNAAKSIFAGFIAENDNNTFSIRKLSQTKYGLDTHPNQDNAWENDKEDAASPESVTHALYPFQIGSMSGDVDGYRWIDNGVAGVVSTKRENEDTRQPLILIHGWQADKNGDFLNRNPDELSKSPEDNHYDAEGYWWTFLRYFSSNDALKAKYKLYIYQYPSYKHITFNARMLSNMLYEVKYIRDWLSQEGKKITILGHSMGGLVARSLLEEHGGIWYRGAGEWKLFKSGADLLDKLITLATPHHGSPAAVYPWMDFADNILVGKDLYSPGALDLWWDGYDGVYHKIQTDNPNDLIDFISCSFNQLNSMRPDQEDMTSFDTHYRNQIPGENENLVFNGVAPSSCILFEVTKFYSHPNPWLTYLNTVKHDPSVWSDKYLYYGGYNDSPFLVNHDGDKLFDTGIYDLGDNAWVTGVWQAGYLNDSPVPVTSSFFDTVKKDCFLDIPACEARTQETIAQWPKGDKLGMFWGNFVFNSPRNILVTSADGKNLRFFRDYHHDRMLNGAYYHSDKGQVIPASSSVEECPQQGNWSWDLVTQSEIIQPCDVYIGPEMAYLPRVFSGFRTVDHRLSYIRDTGVLHATIDQMSVDDSAVTYKDTIWKGTLEFEPLFLMLKRDLLEDFGDINNDGAVNLSDSIIMLQILSGMQPSVLPGSAQIDVNADGKIGLEEVIYSLKIQAGQ